MRQPVILFSYSIKASFFRQGNHSLVPRRQTLQCLNDAMHEVLAVVAGKVCIDIGGHTQTRVRFLLALAWLVHLKRQWERSTCNMQRHSIVCE